MHACFFFLPYCLVKRAILAPSYSYSMHSRLEKRAGCSELLSLCQITSKGEALPLRQSSTEDPPEHSSSPSTSEHWIPDNTLTA